MKKRKWRLPPSSRVGKIIRNLAIALALLCLLWAAYDFPLPTREMVMRRAARQNLIQGPVHLQCRIVRRGNVWAAGVHGEQVLLFQAQDLFLAQEAQVYSYQRQEGGTLMFLGGEWYTGTPPWVLAVDVPEGTASARLTLRVRAEAYVKDHSADYDRKLTEPDRLGRDFLVYDETYEVEGERVGENAFCFQLEKHHPGDDTPEGYLENWLFDDISRSPEQGDPMSTAVDWALEADFYDTAGRVLNSVFLAAPEDRGLELPSEVRG